MLKFSRKDFLKKIKIEKKVFKSKKNFWKFLKENKKLYPLFSYEDIKYRYVRNLFFSRKDLIKKMNDFFHIKKKDYKNAEYLDVRKPNKKLSFQGHNVGLHSHSHDLNFKGLSKNKQIEEYKQNFNKIYKITKIKPNSMSHPLNSYNSKTLKILKKLNIKCGFRSNLNSFNIVNKKVILKLREMILLIFLNI